MRVLLQDVVENLGAGCQYNSVRLKLEIFAGDGDVTVVFISPQIAERLEQVLFMTPPAQTILIAWHIFHQMRVPSYQSAKICYEKIAFTLFGDQIDQNQV